MFLKNISVAVLAMYCMGASLAQAETKLVLNNFVPPNHFFSKVMHEWAADVKEATEGRVVFEIPSGPVAAPAQLLNATRSGIVDAAVMANIFVQKQVPEFSYSSLPFLINDAEAGSVANWKSYEKFLADKKPLKRYGVEILSQFNFSGGQFYTLEDNPITSLDQLKRKRIWALNGYTADTIINLGMSPIVSPAVQISEYVTKGVVDVYYGISLESTIDFKSAPYTKGIMMLPMGATSTSFSFFINQRAWDKLDPKDREVISELSGEALARRVGKRAQEESVIAYKQLMADGVTEYPISSELYHDLQEAAKPLFENFVDEVKKKGVNGQELIDYFMQTYEAEVAKQ